VSFTAPSNINPYKPAQNQVTLTPIVPSGAAGTDQYSLNPAPVVPPATPAHAVLSVTAGMPRDKVQALADSNNAWWKFIRDTLTPNDTNPMDWGMASMWFMMHISRPLYGL
jgi:hypothetical protein